MIFQNKNAIIYGAGGSMGSTIAKAFAQAGGHVFLTGRNIEPLKKVADEISASGGWAEAAVVNAMDDKAVQSHLQMVIARAGRIDISFNLIDLQVIQGMPLTAMTMTDFVRPVATAMQSHFLTATAAAKVMMQQGSGVILALTATPAGIVYPGVGGFGPACSAMEAFYKNLASEIGPYGVRALTIRSAGSPDSAVFKIAIENTPEVMEDVLNMMRNDTMLKAMPLMADIANTAVFMASDLAGKITGVTIDVTCGTTAGLNYRAPAMVVK